MKLSNKLEKRPSQQQTEIVTMDTNNEDREFKSVSELKEWFVTEKDLDENDATEAAAALFEKGFDCTSTLFGMTNMELEEEGVSSPVAVALSNKLKTSPQQQRLSRNAATALKVRKKQRENQRSAVITINDDEEDRIFKSASELKEWLVTANGVHQGMLGDAADMLFERGYIAPLTMIGISVDVLEDMGLSIPLALELRNNLKTRP